MRKTFEINEKDILDHLAAQPNQTEYLKRLIRHDIKHSDQIIDRDAIIEIIEEYLGEKPAKKVDEKVQTSIKSILNLGK